MIWDILYLVVLIIFVVASIIFFKKLLGKLAERDLENKPGEFVVSSIVYSFLLCTSASIVGFTTSWYFGMFKSGNLILNVILSILPLIFCIGIWTLGALGVLLEIFIDKIENKFKFRRRK
jgi:hypothetical protein